MEEGGTVRTTSEAVVIAVTATSMDFSGRSRHLGSIVLRLVLRVVHLDNDRRGGSSSSPLPKPLDSSEFVSSSSSSSVDDEELPPSESPVFDSTTDEEHFLFPFWALEGTALRGAVFFHVRSRFAFPFRKAEERGTVTTCLVLGSVSTDWEGEEEPSASPKSFERGGVLSSTPSSAGRARTCRSSVGNSMGSPVGIAPVTPTRPV